VSVRRVGIGLLLVGVLAVAVFLLRDGVPGVPELRATVAAAGIWGPVVFVLLHAVVNTAPLPRTPFTVAAGVLFGSLTGIGVAVVGTTLAAALSFVVARFVGGSLVERHAHRPPVEWVRKRVRQRGLVTMVSLRLIPVMPFSVMNYGSALSGAAALPYLVATVIGILPGTVSIVILGDAAVGGNPDPVMFVVSVVSGAIGAVGAILVARRPLPPEAVAMADPDDDESDTDDLKRAA
jgi:uncharacterized membrane protein YdjX (TVP38/TMEM64 family)